jgi:hypothetical protein
MLIHVIFEYKDIDDPNSQEADDAVDALEDDIDRANISCDDWWVEEAAADDDEDEDEDNT